MATELRHIAFFFMGIAAICLVMSFSAFQLTTYDSIRSIIGEVATQPSAAVSLHTQFNDMQEQFASGSASSVTYRFAGSQIPVTRAQAQGKNEQQCLSMVLDAFTKSFYTGTDTGSLSFAYGFVGSGANAIYALFSLIFFVIFVAILGSAFMRQWFGTNVELLKSAGLVIVAICIVAFIAFLLLPGLVKSMMWNALYSSTLGQEILHVVEPRVSGTFLVNTLIVMLIGAVLYGVGFFIGFEEAEHAAGGESKASERLNMPQPRSTSQFKDVPRKPGRRQL